MPRRRSVRREPTHEWQEIQQQTLWPEQEVYERLRPLVLFGETAASRAKETGVSERTLRYQADQFEQYGLASLFPKERAPATETGRNLPPEMRQLIVDLKAEYPGFRPHEIATICFLHFDRRPSLVAYLTCGDPDIATTFRIAAAALDAGVDILELGVPFSDPVADGQNVVFLQAKDDAPLAFRELVKGMWVVNHFRLYADLRHDPRRGREQADHLRQEVIGF